MNRAYKLVWNAVSNSWVVASELAKNGKKSSGKRLKLAVLLAAGLTTGVAVAAPAVDALPSGEAIANGTATFDRSVANQLTINQSSNKLITNWNSFDVGSNGKVIFNQPDATAAALNRVSSGSATEIFGQVTANGQLVIVNPSGITFGAGSQVSAASIIGSVLDVQDNGFFAGAPQYNRGSANGSIDNQGSLTATAGSVTLFAPGIKNSGSINATGGNVSLLNLDGASFLAGLGMISSSPSSITGFIQQSGNITATQVSSVGGKILLTGDTSQSNSQIQLAGTLDATTNTSVNGRSIVVNGDVNLNGTANALDLTSIDGYSLTNDAALNLNGASSAFSVNGTAYTVIRDVTQLQGMSADLARKYVLALNIDASDTVNWDSGAGFVPVGTSASRFTGTLDGLGHEINSLYINRPTLNSAGLFGATSNAILKNMGITNATVVGNAYAGILAGNVGTGASGYSQIDRVYTTGNVTTTLTNNITAAGGLVGMVQLTQDGSLVDISRSYSQANVSSPWVAGGLLGYVFLSASNSSSATVNVTDTYAGGTLTKTTGSFSASQGGLIGGIQINGNGGTGMVKTVNVNRAYATGAMATGTGSRAGLVGGTYNAVTNTGGAVIGFNISNASWDIDTTGRSSAIGAVGASTVQTNLTGLSSSQAKSLAFYSNWGSNIDAQAGTGATWRIYEGYTGPLLRTFLKPLSSVVVNNASKTYDGTTFSSAEASFSADAGADTSKLFVGLTGGRNAGTYTLDAYSNQQGYDFNATSGTLTINKANLVISSGDVTKTYDGTTSAVGSAVAAGGTQLFGTDNLSGGTFAFSNKNAGTGKTVTVSGVTVNDGNNGGNYDVSYTDNTSSTINKANLKITSSSVHKVYDGTTDASGSARVTGGTQLFADDSLSGGTFVFDGKNASMEKVVYVSGVTVNDGNNGDNYNVSYVQNSTSSIDRALLTITATAASKVYDGTLRIDDKPIVSGRVRGDSISGLSQSFTDRNAGTGKAVLVNNSFVIRDGNGGNNYDVVVVDGTAGVITPKNITVSTVANSKVYDGGVTSANKPVVTGLELGDRITGLFQRYDSKTVGENKKLLIKSGYVVQDGNGGNNYTVTEQGSNDGVITAN